MSDIAISAMKFAKIMRETAEAMPDSNAGIRRLLTQGAAIIEDRQSKYAEEHDRVTNLCEDRDQAAFVFTTRIKAVCDEFDGKLSTAAAIGAFEIVKHELIADALEDD